MKHLQDIETMAREVIEDPRGAEYGSFEIIRTGAAFLVRHTGDGYTLTMAGHANFKRWASAVGLI